MEIDGGVVWRPREVKEVARVLPLARYFLPPEWMTVRDGWMCDTGRSLHRMKIFVEGLMGAGGGSYLVFGGYARANGD